MSIHRETLDFLDRPGKNLVILSISDIESEYGSIFDFSEKIDHWSEDEWTTGLLRREDDDGKGSRIMLVSYPSKIREDTVTGERIYVVENVEELNPALTPYHISP